MIVAGMYWEQAVAPGGGGVGVGDGSGVVLTRESSRKGRKERTVPLWPETVQVLKAWFRELGEPAVGMTFPNTRGTPLSRDGVDYL